MKFNGKSVAITTGLCLILGLVLLIEIALFISGPTRKYEAGVQRQIDAIQSKYQEVSDIERHVFQYIVYVGVDEEHVVWFNENAEAIVSKELSSLQKEAALREAQKNYGVENASVSLGYGYNNPVYVIQAEQCEILLDYDTLKEVYYIDKDVRG